MISVTREKRIVATLKEVAAHYGVRLDTVTRRWRSGGMPGSKGKWDLDAIDVWRSTRQNQKDRSGTLTIHGRAVSDPPSEQPIQSDLFDAGTITQAKAEALIADARKKKADARIKEIQALRAENVGLVELDEVEEFMSNWLSEARNILKAVPIKMKRFGLDVSKAAEKELDLALHAIRKRSERLVELRRDS